MIQETSLENPFYLDILTGLHSHSMDYQAAKRNVELTPPTTPPLEAIKVPSESNVWHRRLNNWDPHHVVAAQGLCYTLADGRTVLDAVSGGAAVASVGHAHPSVIAALQQHLTQGIPTYAHTYAFTTSPAEELATLLIDSAPGMSKVLFVSSGSEANDSAMKLARQYHLERNDSQRTTYIARNMSYHGNTIGALSLSGHKTRRAPYEAILTDCVVKIPECHTYRGKASDESDESYLERLKLAYEAEFASIGGEKVIAVWAEPVVGAALGCATSVPGYFRMLRSLCDQHGALLVFDEVMSGIGRTGTYHAWEQEGVMPDIQVIAKGLGGGYAPIAAIMVSEKVTAAFKSGSGVFVNGHTYSAHPFACSAALAVQRVIRRENLVENAASMGALLQRELERHVAPLGIVGDVRGRGLFWAIEYVSNKTTKEPFDLSQSVAQRVHDRAMELGLVIFAGVGCADGTRGDFSMIMPSLNVTPDLIVRMVTLLRDAIMDVQASL